MPEPSATRPPPLPLRRHLNGLVLGGLLATLTMPIGSAAAEYAGEVWPNLFTLGSAVTAFALLAVGLRVGPTKDSREVARRGVPARAVIEGAKLTSMTQSRGEDGPTVARVVLLDLRIEAEGEPVTRVRLRRWVHVQRLGQMKPGVVLGAKILPGRPQDPALGLRR